MVKSFVPFHILTLDPGTIQGVFIWTPENSRNFALHARATFWALLSVIIFSVGVWASSLWFGTPGRLHPGSAGTSLRRPFGGAVKDECALD